GVMDWGEVGEGGREKVRRGGTIKEGGAGDRAKTVVRIVKERKSKVQASSQGDAVRGAGGKRDDLQSTIALLRKEVTDTPLDFNNFRD
ncbi:YajQ family cyclic di-GMP-binding protein, partial [Burkholderia pseudomallei]